MKNLICARLSTYLPSIPLPDASGAIPTDIQWMPPGTHTITATVAGKPGVTTVRVGPDTAERMQSQLTAVTSRADAGAEDRPYFDFNHSDDAASAHPTAFYWGGEDPVKGGVRARLEWTESGRAAVAGRAYRRFSPAFFTNANGEVVSAPLNMGGLVNRAAFKTIAPIWSREADLEGADSTEEAMEGNKELADLKAAITARDAEITSLQAKLASQDTATAIKAKDAEITALTAKVAELEKLVQDQKLVTAKAVVEAAVKSGRLAPQDKTNQDKWVAIIAADPSNSALLDAMPVNPALQSVVAKGTDTSAPGKAQEKLPPNEVELWNKR